jgi:pimeloyl-ACP methyl ester carboxylesterase
VLEALSPQRRRLVLAGVIIAVVVVVVVAATVAVRFSRTPPAPPQDEPGPVLLVPGYGGGTDALLPLQSAVRAAGREAVIAPAFGDGIGDLDAQAARLAELATATRDGSGAPSVDVIGYSAGGVVARLWVRSHGGAAVARRVLTIGAPHHGTSQAALGSQLAGGCPLACQQLVPGSDLLRRLNAGDETPAGPAWATVRSTSDVVVTPADSAALAGAVNVLIQDVCAGSTAGHGDLPANPVVRAMIDSALGDGPPRPPSGVSC